ncbi:MAG: L-seryl-tRNA(Sec) selenium transferase [Deltaproteobacteria bacterium]|nr:MAG: L-seryl-tRNA(Sec) selenium transferase [Deltaproteobacteria bacterium]
MGLSSAQQAQLKALPGIDQLLLRIEKARPDTDIPKSIRLAAARKAVDTARQQILTETCPETVLDPESLVTRGCQILDDMMRPNLRRVINATGVVVHTNLGRSLLPETAMDHIRAIGRRYSNLEFDLSSGKRGLRYTAVEDLLCELTGADAAIVVNNNAAAVLLSLETLAKGRDVIVSRGELVEIGGSFRIPDVMTRSGCTLREVGTTNRTHLQDYAAAIHASTGLLLKVHTSNFSVVGFTKAVTLEALVGLGKETGLPVMEDLGSGTLIDFSRYGLVKEPTVAESVRAGVDIVTFSGDKLLGGPQAGIILGSRKHIHAIRKNQMTRALRIDKLTLSALEMTLRLYRDEPTAVRSIPTLRMLTVPLQEIDAEARRLHQLLTEIGDPRLTVSIVDKPSKAGGGSLPLLELPSRCLNVAVSGMSANRLEAWLRTQADPPVIGRIDTDGFLLDLRTLQPEEPALIRDAFRSLLAQV